MRVTEIKIANDPFENLKQDTLKVWHIDGDMNSKYYIQNINIETEPNGYHVITLTTSLLVSLIFQWHKHGKVLIL